MKPHKVIFDEPDRMEVVATIPDKTQKIIQTIKPHKGHTLFEINPITGKCKVAEYESVDVKFPLTKSGDTAKKKKVIAKDSCVYIAALNKKNALIKFFKMVGRQIENKSNKLPYTNK